MYVKSWLRLRVSRRTPTAAVMLLTMFAPRLPLTCWQKNNQPWGCLWQQLINWSISLSWPCMVTQSCLQLQSTRELLQMSSSFGRHSVPLRSLQEEQEGWGIVQQQTTGLGFAEGQGLDTKHKKDTHVRSLSLVISVGN